MRVLVSAYACEPGRGSEPGAGWTWALAAGRRHDVVVLTRANNRPAIERALRDVAEPRPRFVYVDLPGWARSWKRGGRGLRTYYVLWQLAALRAGRRLHRERPFDVVHHLTFANVWLPAPTWLVPAPFVLGPVGGGPQVPLRLYRALGIRGAAHEAALVVARRLSSLNPLVRLGWRRASVVLVQNDETLRRLPRGVRRKAVIRPNPCVPPMPPRGRQRPWPTAVYAGRLVPWKGVAVAVEALCSLPEWTLLIVGEGPDRMRLERLVQRAGLGTRVGFAPWLPREELWAEVARATALVVPSLREDASFAAAEAQALGVPVAAFDHGGPAALAAAPGARFELAPLRSGSSAAADLAAALRRTAAAEPPSADFGAEQLAAELTRVYRRATEPLQLPRARAAA